MRKYGYFILAWISLSLGIFGIVLPLLPTTPFILLAAFGFSKSSPRFHGWLLSHSLFGPLIINWQQEGVITLKTKLVVTLSMATMLSISFYFVSVNLVLKMVMVLAVLSVLFFIWTRPSQLHIS